LTLLIILLAFQRSLDWSLVCRKWDWRRENSFFLRWKFLL